MRIKLLKRLKKPNWSQAKLSFVSSIQARQSALLRHLQNLKKLKNLKNLDLKKLKDLRSDEFLHKIETYISIRNAMAYARLGAIAVAAYFLADTFSLFADYMVPDPPVVPPPPIVFTQKKAKSDMTASADEIIKRNIFNSRGIIPDEQFIGGIPRKTNLPLTLVGSMVLENELNSIATIEDKSQSKTFPVQVDDVINGNLRITRIEERRVYFNNINNGAFEYVEMPEELASIDLEISTVSGIDKNATGVTQIAPNQYEVDRSVIDKSLSNLPDLLRQARAVPNFENGVPSGYRIMEVSPGSFFALLGIKPGDVVTAFNGDPVNDPGKALQLLNDLKNSDRASVTLKRNGQTVNTNVVFK